MRTVFAAGTLPPPSDQNSDSFDEQFHKRGLSPFFADSKNRAITSIGVRELQSNFGADSTRGSSALRGFRGKRSTDFCRNAAISL